MSVTGDDAADRNVVGRFLHAVHEVARQCDAEGLFGTPEITLSAGGSAVFDLVARGLPLPLSRPVRTILRSGCYVTHDSKFYERFLREVLARSGAAWQERGGLEPALEIWTEVQSRPEPGLAILAFGKRDASFDIDLPMPFARVRAGVRTPLDAAWRIDRLNDQHAYLADSGRCRYRRRRSRRQRHLASLHDVRQVAMDAGCRRRLRCHGRHTDVLLTRLRASGQLSRRRVRAGGCGGGSGRRMRARSFERAGGRYRRRRHIRTGVDTRRRRHRGQNLR